jgi:CRP-like cAMP-binding protein
VIPDNTTFIEYPNNPCQALYVVVHGEVSLVSTPSSSGDEIKIVRTLGPGAIFGEWSLYSDAASSDIRTAKTGASR